MKIHITLNLDDLNDAFTYELINKADSVMSYLLEAKEFTAKSMKEEDEVCANVVDEFVKRMDEKLEAYDIDLLIRNYQR